LVAGIVLGIKLTDHTGGTGENSRHPLSAQRLWARKQSLQSKYVSVLVDIAADSGITPENYQKYTFTERIRPQAFLRFFNLSSMAKIIPIRGVEIGNSKKL